MCVHIYIYMRAIFETDKPVGSRPAGVGVTGREGREDTSTRVAETGAEESGEGAVG